MTASGTERTHTLQALRRRPMELLSRPRKGEGKVDESRGHKPWRVWRAVLGPVVQHGATLRAGSPLEVSGGEAYAPYSEALSHRPYVRIRSSSGYLPPSSFSDGHPSHFSKMVAYTDRKST